jgi:heme/copper-type cytochrome/quinol oxidase subunit 2
MSSFGIARTTRIGLVVAAVAVLALVSTMTGVGAPPAVTVQVKIYEHPKGSVTTPGKITFQPGHVKSGTVVTFEITNMDPIIFHNFQINGKQTRVMGPHGGRAIIRNLKFTTPGKYVGSVPDDNHSGIGGIFVVS